MGSWNAGKTYNALKLAEKLQSSGSGAQMYVIDTDFAMDRMLDGEFGHLENVTHTVADEWPAYTAALDSYNNKMTDQDWLVIDMIGPAWDLVQEYFVDMVFGGGMDEFFLKARVANTKGSPLDGFKDWTVINKLYRKSTLKLVGCKGHVLCTSQVEPVNYDKDDKQIRNTFGNLGVKPKGQKHTAHLFHTILLLAARKNDDWRVTTAKDRGRKHLIDVQLRDFPTQYLIARAGWKP